MERQKLTCFPKDPQSWTFTINGSVLQVKPSTPSITRGEETVTYPSITEAPAWTEIKSALHKLVFTRLQLNPKPEAANTVEILAP